MGKRVIVLFVIILLSLLSVVHSRTIPIYVKPLSGGNVQPSASFSYTFNWTTDSACTSVVFSNSSLTITTGTDGIGFINLSIPDSLSAIPTYLCEYRGGSLRAVHPLSMQFFYDIVGNSLNVTHNVSGNWLIGKVNYSNIQNTQSVGNISGDGASGYICQFSASNTINNSGIFQSGSKIGIGTTAPDGILHLKTGDSGSAVLVQGTGIYLESSSNVNFVFRSPDTATQRIEFVDTLTGSGQITYNHATDAMTFYAGSSTIMTLFNGSMGINDATPGAMLDVSASSASTIGQIIQGASSQTANLQEWQNSSGNIGLYVNASGNDICITGGNCLGYSSPNYLAITAVNVSVTQLITLSVSTIPACSATYNGTIARNDTGVYVCGNTGSTWTKI
ncbi:MAG: hypothetical protein RL557_217 [archaeon]